MQFERLEVGRRESELAIPTSCVKKGVGFMATHPGRATAPNVGENTRRRNKLNQVATKSKKGISISVMLSKSEYSALCLRFRCVMENRTT